MAEKNQEEIKLLGFNFTSINAEKNPNFEGKLEIKQNINIADVEKYKTTSTKKEALKVDFVYDVVYTDLGNISLKGTMFLSLDAKTQKEVLKGWKDKKIPEKINLAFLNIIIHKSTIKALALEDDLGLPPHIQLPRIKSQ